MKQKKISVVGANSFLARNIINELIKHDYLLNLIGRREVAVGAKATFEYFNHPDSPLNFKNLLTADVIIYTAGAGIQSNVQTSSDLIFQVNAFLPISLIQYLQDNNYQGQVITFGSYFEIGNSQEEKCYSEEEYLSHNNRLPNNYCISKRLLSQYISQKLQELPFSLAHFVLPNIYGFGENPNRLIPYLVDSIINKKPVNLSSGTQQRQYLHAKDVVEVVKKTIDNPVAGIYNITNPAVISVKELVQAVIDKATDTANLEINFGSVTKRDVGMQYLALCPNHTERTLNWNASVSLPEGIMEYYQNYVA